MINHLFTKIAQEELGIETLETRNSDSLDFHDVSVAGLTRAFQRAFNSGANSVVTEDYKDNDVNTIAIDKEVYDELFAVTKWVDLQPSTKRFEAGDSFMENVVDFQQRCVSENDYPSDTYIAFFEMSGGDLFAMFDDGSGENLTAYKIVPK